MESQKQSIRFRKGLLHIGRFFLIPPATEEIYGQDWLHKLNSNLVKSELNLARNAFQDAGEIGKPIVQQIRKVELRMDSDEDGQISDEEVQKYFAAKVRIFTSW